MFVTNSLSRRTLLQINLRQLHSVPCATRYASLPAPTSCFQAKVGTMMLQMWHVCPFTTAAIRLLRSIFIWAPPRTRPKFPERSKIFSQQDAHTRFSVSRCCPQCNISRLPLSCMFYASDCFIDIFHDESVVSHGTWPLPRAETVRRDVQLCLTHRRVLGWHHRQMVVSAPSNAHFLQNNWPTSFYQIVFGFHNSELPGTNERMCRRICSSKTSALAGIPSTGRTHLHPQILYATCLCTKILFVVNCCHVQRCGRCRRVSFNTKTHNRLASSLASSFENRM